MSDSSGLFCGQRLNSEWRTLQVQQGSLYTELVFAMVWNSTAMVLMPRMIIDPRLMYNKKWLSMCRALGGIQLNDMIFVK